MNSRAVVWAGILSVGWATPALADESPAKPPAKAEYTLSLLAGYGAGGQFEDDTTNRYGLALGARAGLTLAAPRLYFGLSFLHFGGSQAPSGKHFTNTLDGELGYELRLLQEHLLIRPQLAFGVAQAATIQSDYEGVPLALHMAPGVLVGVRFAPLLVTAEYRHDLVPDSWPSSNTVLFGCGLLL
jgi:hypothetical protein